MPNWIPRDRDLYPARGSSMRRPIGLMALGLLAAVLVSGCDGVRTDAGG